MNAKGTGTTYFGHMLVRRTPDLRYRGVDREHFEPVVHPKDIVDIDRPPEHRGLVWPLLAPGWKRDAYRLFEDNLVQECADDLLYLVADVEVAKEIRNFIYPHLGEFEILECTVGDIGSPEIPQPEKIMGFLGYDVAYPGGDLYSAVKNAIGSDHLLQSHPDLADFFNEHHLLPDADLASPFIRIFRENVVSESSSDFSLYALALRG